MLFEYAKKVLKNSKNTQLINIYGPTECTAATTTYLLNKKTPTNIPIGKPIDNTKCYIVDKNQKICPIGVDGELYIGGEGVGNGYINNYDLTKQFFIDFKSDNIYDYIYKSGDIVRWNYDGNISFVGRKDNQIKIRGYRIEIGEIENFTLKYNGIEQVYIKFENGNNTKWLSMFIVANKIIDIKDLKRYLSNNIPDYMIPSCITQIKVMPLNTSGKVDTSRLISNYNYEKTIIPPTTKVEKAIFVELKKIIGSQDISIDDDIFDLGLESISAIKLMSALEKNNINIKYGDLYTYRSIKNIAMNYNSIDKNKYSEIIENYDYTNINKILNTQYSYNKLTNKHNIILTGATGFLGIHILNSLLKLTKSDIYCVIRRTDVDAYCRLEEKINYYFDNNFLRRYKKRLKVLEYDIVSKDFNEDIENIILNNNISVVINTAANVKHYGNENDFLSNNISAVENLIYACKNTNIRLVHISTLSVSGNGLEDGFTSQSDKTERLFSENSLYVGQNIRNIYSYSKYMAELRVLESINNGLKANIVRVGNLMNRFSDGKFQQNIDDNGFIQRIRFVLKNKIIPRTVYENNYLEFSPIDVVSNIISNLIIKIDTSYPVYHLYNHNHVYLPEFVDKVKKLTGYKIDIVDDSNFIDFIKKSAITDNAAILYADISTNNKLDYSSPIIVSDMETSKLLKKLRLKWPKITSQYLKKFLKAIGG